MALLRNLLQMLTWKPKKTEQSQAVEETQKSDKIIELPDEILMKIALCLDGHDRNTDLQCFALAHRSFCSVAREALIRNGVIPLRWLPQYIERLIQHPKWADQITCLQVAKRDWSVGWLSRWDMIPLRPTAATTCEESLCKMLPDVQRNKVKRDLRCHPDYLTVCLCVLMSMLPNLKALSIGTSSFHLSFVIRLLAIKGFDFPLDFWAAPAGSAQVVTLLAEKLQVLHILRDWKNELEGFIDVHHFSSLRSLSVPSEFIVEPARLVDLRMQLPEARTPKAILPPQLEHLRIFCYRQTFPLAWLEHLYYSRERFSNLELVELYFRCTFDTFMEHATHDIMRLEFLELLKNWEASASSLETFFQRGTLSSHDPSYFCYESLLGPLELMDKERRRAAIMGGIPSSILQPWRTA